MADMAISNVPVGISFDALTPGQLDLVRQAQERLIGITQALDTIRTWVGLRKIVLYKTGGTTFKLVGRVAGGTMFRQLAEIDTSKEAPLSWLVGTSAWAPLTVPSEGPLPASF